MTNPTALIVGASRGLGLALAREFLNRRWSVIATGRGGTHTGLDDLAAWDGSRLEIEAVDITVPAEVAALRRRLDGRTIDLLFISAGIGTNVEQPIEAVPTEDFVRLMVTNALSPMRVLSTLEDLVPTGGTLGVMSSGLGSLTENDQEFWAAYGASKAALNMLMRGFAARRPGDPRAMILMDPGWVRTEMGGPGADLEIEDSIPGVAGTLIASAGRPGLRFLDYTGRTVAW
jgi:NAD(P)-dependent dehydrogenase (short-subunit alcohol dehydrogenase family)